MSGITRNYMQIIQTVDIGPLPLSDLRPFGLKNGPVPLFAPWGNSMRNRWLRLPVRTGTTP